MEETTHPEKKLLEELSIGNEKAFDELFRLYFPRLKRFLISFIDSTEEAEDLAQDVFVKLWQNRHSLPLIKNLNAYLYRMAKNTVYTYLENKIRTEIHTPNQTIEIPTVETLEEMVFAKELEELIDLTIRRMPPQRQTIFILSRKEGINNEEIAKRLNISKRTVETHISSALADLRKVLPSLLLFF